MRCSRGIVFECPEGYYLDAEGYEMRAYYPGGDTRFDLIFEDSAESTAFQGCAQEMCRSLNALVGVGDGIAIAADGRAPDDCSWEEQRLHLHPYTEVGTPVAREAISAEANFQPFKRLAMNAPKVPYRAVDDMVSNDYLGVAAEKGNLRRACAMAEVMARPVMGQHLQGDAFVLEAL